MSAQSDFTAIASHEYICVRPDGVESALNFELGTPVLASGNTATCPVRLRGHAVARDRVTELRGEGTLQALCLAVAYGHTMVKDMLSRGYTLLDPEERHEVTIAAIDAVFRTTASDESDA